MTRRNFFKHLSGWLIAAAFFPALRPRPTSPVRRVRNTPLPRYRGDFQTMGARTCREVVWVGTNDLRGGGSAAQCWALVQRCIAQAQAHGCGTVLVA